MEIKTYAPVIIPTLNRFDHFKRCLESLEMCYGADKTVVYVALDYPPSDKYVEGWKTIDAYLCAKEQNNSFKSLVVFRRKENYFFSGKGNGQTAINDLPSDVDRYIFSEDDNEFSPCFLDFMNQALEKYKDDQRVYSVCGYNQENFYVKNKQIVFVYDNSAWGIGRWKNREILTIDYAKNVMRSPLKVFKLWRTYPAFLLVVLGMLNKNLRFGDALSTMKCICEKQYQLRPSLSLVRNYGDDGSGQHSTKSGKFSLQAISKNLYFDFPNTKLQRSKELDEKLRYNMLPNTFFKRVLFNFYLAKKLLIYMLIEK